MHMAFIDILFISGKSTFSKKLGAAPNVKIARNSKIARITLVRIDPQSTVQPIFRAEFRQV